VNSSGGPRDFFLQKGFLPVTKESISLFRRYDDPESMAMENTAVIITVWGGPLGVLYKVIGGFLCFLAAVEGVPVHFEIRPPAGKARRSLEQCIAILYGLAGEAGLPSLCIAAVEERFLPFYASLSGFNVHTEYSDDHSEYIYKIKDILELAGTANFYKRKRIKQYAGDEKVTIEEIDENNIRECFTVQETWCAARDCSFCASFAGCEKKALEYMVSLFDKTLYQGVLCRYDGNPEGYALWECRGTRTAFVYFAQANRPNLNVYLYYEFVKSRLFAMEYLNVNEDMGNMGLRQFKSHLSAHTLLRKYNCILKKVEEI
jgi:hypothetical protein